MTPSPPVVDASVAIKWLVREPLSANAVALLRQTTRAGQLLEGAEATPTVARVFSRLAIRSMLSGQFDETIELCRRALTIADEFDLEDIRAHVLNTQGVARITRGDLGGLTDMEASIEIAERLNAADAMIRGYKNLGSVLADLGELERSAELQRRGADAAHRFGADYQSRWFETELGIHAYLAGDWDSAEGAFNRLNAWIAEVGPHYMEAAARSCRAKIRAARGDLGGAQLDIDSSLDFAALLFLRRLAVRCSTEDDDGRPSF